MKPLWQHQKNVLNHVFDKTSYALFHSPGTGKSRTLIEIYQQKNAQENRILKCLILAPSVVTFNWKREFDLYSNIKSKHVMVLHGSGKDRLRQLQNTPEYFVVICNYETLLMDEVFEALKAWSPDFVAGDELHRVKNRKAQRTRRAIALSALAKYRFGLTGTPILQNSIDLFSQFEFLDHGKTFGKNFFTFKNRYFRDENAAIRMRSPHVTWPKLVPIKAKESELQELILRSASVVKKEDCLDLPPFVRQVVEVELSKDQAKAYKEMKEDFITFVNSKAYTAQLAIVKALRLQQIASGFLMGSTLEDPSRPLGLEEKSSTVHVFKSTPRERALLDLLEEITEHSKVIIWACWRANHEIISELLRENKYEYRALLGDMSQVDRDTAIRDFRENENVRVLVGSQGAGGIGINLVEASYCIYFSRNFSLEHDVQSEARNYRGGSEVHSKVTRIDLIAKNTIDEEISKALANKQDISDRIIMDAVK